MLPRRLSVGVLATVVCMNGCAGLAGSCDANEEHVSIRMPTARDINSYNTVTAQNGEQQSQTDVRARLMNKAQSDGNTIGVTFGTQLSEPMGTGVFRLTVNVTERDNKNQDC